MICSIWQKNYYLNVKSSSFDNPNYIQRYHIIFIKFNSLLPPFFFFFSNWNKISSKKKLTNVSQSLSNKFDDSTSFLGPPSWVCTNRPMMLDRCNPQPTLLINIATTILILLITNLLFFEVVLGFSFATIIFFPFQSLTFKQKKKIPPLNQNILKWVLLKLMFWKLKKT